MRFFFNSQLIKVYFHFDGGSDTDLGGDIQLVDILLHVGQTHAGAETHVAHLGADWQALPRLGFSLDLSMGFTGLFPADFSTVEQTLYPLYGTLGVCYEL